MTDVVAALAAPTYEQRRATAKAEAIAAWQARRAGELALLTDLQRQLMELTRGFPEAFLDLHVTHGAILAIRQSLLATRQARNTLVVCLDAEFNAVMQAWAEDWPDPS